MEADKTRKIDFINSTYTVFTDFNKKSEMNMNRLV